MPRLRAMIVRRGALRAGRRPSHPLLTALVMFGGPLVQLVTSRYLLASSDLVRPRTAMMMTGVVAACVDSIQVIPSLPWWMRFVLVAVISYLSFRQTKVLEEPN